MPSLINQLALDELKAIVAAAPSVILVDPAGLKSAESLKLRKSLSGVGAKMRVAKASLINRACPESVRPHLTGKGTVGLVTAKDPAAAAKVLAELVKEEKLKIRGGLLEGQALDAKQASDLADLPPREVLIGRLVGLLNSPVQRIVTVLNALPQGLASVVDQASKKA